MAPNVLGAIRSRVPAQVTASAARAPTAGLHHLIAAPDAPHAVRLPFVGGVCRNRSAHAHGHTLLSRETPLGGLHPLLASGTSSYLAVTVRLMLDEGDQLGPYGENPDNLASFGALLDTNLLDAGGKWGDRLRSLCSERWVQGHISDTVLTETGEAKDADTRQRLAQQISLHIITFGTARRGHTQWDLGMWGGPADEARFRAVYAALWPGHDPSADGGRGANRTGRTRFRDAMHVDTATRNGFDAFVTTDGGVLHRASQLAVAFPNRARVMSPHEAVLEVVSRVQGIRKLYKLEDHSYPLPERPSPDEIAQWRTEA